MNFFPLLSKNCDNPFGRLLYNGVKSLCWDQGGLSLISLLLLANHLCSTWHRGITTWGLMNDWFFSWSLPLSSFTYDSVFIFPWVISVMIHLTLMYTRLCVRPLWSRVNPTVPEATKSPFTLVHSDLVFPWLHLYFVHFFPLPSTTSDLLLFLRKFLEVLTCYFLFHLCPCLLSTLPSQYSSRISPRWEGSDALNRISHPIARGSFLFC